MVAGLTSPLSNHNTWIMLAPSVVLLYEPFALFTDEADLVWGNRISWVTGIFGANRLSSLGFAITSFITLWGSECNVSWRWAVTSIPWGTGEVVLIIVWAAFSALRVQALGIRTSIFVPLVSVLCLIPAGFNTFTTVYASLAIKETLRLPYSSCDSPTITLSGVKWNSMAMDISSRLFSIASDTIIIVLTWRVVYSTKKAADKMNVRLPLHDLLLREGILWFILLLLLNIGAAISYSLPSSVNISHMVYCFQSIIVSRFILHVRAVGQHRFEDGQSLTTLGDLDAVIQALGPYPDTVGGTSLDDTGTDEINHIDSEEIVLDLV